MIHKKNILCGGVINIHDEPALGKRTDALFAQ